MEIMIGSCCKLDQFRQLETQRIRPRLLAYYAMFEIISCN